MTVGLPVYQTREAKGELFAHQGISLLLLEEIQNPVWKMKSPRIEIARSLYVVFYE